MLLRADDARNRFLRLIVIALTHRQPLPVPHPDAEDSRYVLLFPRLRSG